MTAATAARPPVRYRRLPTLEMPLPQIPPHATVPTPEIHRVFDLRMALDPAEREAAAGVRWQVYCRELGYEPAERFADRRERDADDARSLHLLAVHRASGRAAACCRLVLADPGAPQAPFHVEQVCAGLHPGAIPADPGRRLGCAEISRFCILAEFRHGAREAPAGVDAAAWAQEEPHHRGLAALMLAACAHLGAALRLDYLLTLMEPRAQVLARRWGFAFEPIGAPVDFRGVRLPFRVDRRFCRALLASGPIAALVAPAAARWEEQAGHHPLVGTYRSQATARIPR